MQKSPPPLLLGVRSVCEDVVDTISDMEEGEKKGCQRLIGRGQGDAKQEDILVTPSTHADVLIVLYILDSRAQIILMSAQQAFVSR